MEAILSTLWVDGHVLNRLQVRWRMIRVRPLTGYRYEVAEDITRVMLHVVGFNAQITTEDGRVLSKLEPDRLNIYKGYCSDGTSFAPLNTLNSLRGALIHDPLCQMVRLGLIPESLEDAIALEARSVWFETMSSTRAMAQYRALRIAHKLHLGGNFCRRHKNDYEPQDDIIEAP